MIDMPQSLAATVDVSSAHTSERQDPSGTPVLEAAYDPPPLPSCEPSALSALQLSGILPLLSAPHKSDIVGILRSSFPDEDRFLAATLPGKTAMFFLRDGQAKGKVIRCSLTFEYSQARNCTCPIRFVRKHIHVMKHTD